MILYHKEIAHFGIRGRSQEHPVALRDPGNRALRATALTKDAVDAQIVERRLDPIAQRDLFASVVA